MYVKANLPAKQDVFDEVGEIRLLNFKIRGGRGVVKQLRSSGAHQRVQGSASVRNRPVDQRCRATRRLVAQVMVEQMDK